MFSDFFKNRQSADCTAQCKYSSAGRHASGRKRKHAGPLGSCAPWGNGDARELQAPHGTTHEAYETTTTSHDAPTASYATTNGAQDPCKPSLSGRDAPTWVDFKVFNEMQLMLIWSFSKLIRVRAYFSFVYITWNTTVVKRKNVCELGLNYTTVVGL